jgi:hypothetical protein
MLQGTSAASLLEAHGKIEIGIQLITFRFDAFECSTERLLLLMMLMVKASCIMHCLSWQCSTDVAY